VIVAVSLGYTAVLRRSRAAALASGEVAR